MSLTPTEEDYGLNNTNANNNAFVANNTPNNNTIRTVNNSNSNNNGHPTRISKCWSKTKSEARLLRVLLIVLILANLPKNIGNYALYPFTIFSTWIHESCHGIAALLVGGKVQWLKIYANTSGLTMTIINPTKFNGSFVSSAGYCGTAITGGILLLFRKIPWASRCLMVLLGTIMIVSVIVYVRNVFGMVSVSILSGIFFLGSYFLNNFWIMEVLAFVAAATCLNSIMYISYLFGQSQGSVGGELRSTDAYAMQLYTGVSRYFWATLWMLLSLFMVTVGIFCGFQGTRNSGGEEKNTDTDRDDTISDKDDGAKPNGNTSIISTSTDTAPFTTTVEIV
mmetsp:Transcript_14698/g.20987  ORF Transcript_14698/g.20987 Transcript_14698/m.20987 type:complete len:337 (+) Transcript_14698:219-1229(+)